MDSSAAISVKRICFSDFEAMRQAVPNASAEIVQLERGRMSGRITQVSLSKSLDLTLGSFSRGLMSRGVVSQTRAAIALAQSTGRIAGMRIPEVRPSDLCIVPPGMDRQLRYFGTSSFVGVLLDPRDLGDAVADLPHWRHPTPSVVNTSETTLHDLKMMVEQIACHAPHNAADYYRRAILDLITQWVSAAPIVGRQFVRSWSLMHDITDYLQATQKRLVHISELCDQFAVSRRTLHRMFEERIGMAPIAYLRHKRLCDVHSVLQSGNATSVSEVAMNHGFVAPGRFAGRYRALFGEFPSETLQRGTQRLKAGSSTAPA